MRLILILAASPTQNGVTQPQERIDYPTRLAIIQANKVRLSGGIHQYLYNTAVFCVRPIRVLEGDNIAGGEKWAISEAMPISHTHEPLETEY